ncbi:MAG: hypothetical protein COX81_04050 [Candidatus Magasanikbacteria bacterium CG_4_10_14_0_2_um_filter_37_12]|uniref:Dihydrofolate reductase n=1 Tax=Candidatus Magasanikbacteria bacterium CG_4_10_14_0_2_um_filter_37_12 TaxID=1974637 RepID=A0A2M7V6I0_9BACT|nr:MAG: hypothetical protein COX81_04050 [Candidatus Magasanikbacteria bacterium CG_4_10_14_0_2_um_filter_37_12]
MITLVAAISKNNCIGKNNDLPWNIPEDFKHMHKLTLGKVLIMGRKTWESIPENHRPLQNRTNVVITRNNDYELPEGVERYDSIQEALLKHKDEEIVGFGGQKIFEEMILIADVLEITHVDQVVEECHAFFPSIDLNVWQETWRKNYEGFNFVTYKKI